MVKSNNQKKTLWIYIIVFFAVIFVLLIITAFSQIKFSKNIDEYKNKIVNEQNDKNKFQINLNTALEENKSLHNEVDKLNKDINDLKNQLTGKNNEASILQEKYNRTLKFYESLARAEEEYNKGNVSECALILKGQVLKDEYDDASKQLYNELAQSTYFKASENLYYEGYNLYTKRNFSGCVEKFKNSLLISENEYFSDDNYYYLAYAEYNNGNVDKAVDYMKDLINKYSNSMFRSDAQKFIDTYGNK